MAKTSLTTPTILATSALVLWNALEANGYDGDEVFLHAGLDPARLKDEGARYTARSITRLHRMTIEMTDDPCFMLKLADFWHPSHLHALGYGWMASPTLKEAFGRLVRYYDIVSASAERIRLEQTQPGYLFSVDVPEDLPPLHESEEDSLMVVLTAMCRISAGAAFKPIAVEMRRNEPPCAEEFSAYFGAPVSFTSSSLSMLLPAPELEVGLPTVNTSIARACDQIIDQYLSRLDREHVVNQVRVNLVEIMPSGQVTEERIAERLHVSVRTLQRKLRRHGTTFKHILGQTRQELARSYIKEKHTSLGEITYLLGYSDPANFSRAYKRWTGMSPSSGRASHRSTHQ